MTHPNSPKQEKFIVSSDGSQPLCKGKDKEYFRNVDRRLIKQSIPDSFADTP
nr:MAG TPA: hypothetical protein [Caudoviricetes sp.]